MRSCRKRYHLLTLSAYRRGSLFSASEGMYGGRTSTDTRLMNCVCSRMKCHRVLCTRPHPLLLYLRPSLSVTHSMDGVLHGCRSIVSMPAGRAGALPLGFPGHHISSMSESCYRDMLRSRCTHLDLYCSKTGSTARPPTKAPVEKVSRQSERFVVPSGEIARIGNLA